MKRFIQIIVIILFCFAGFALAGVLWGVDLFFAPQPPGADIPQEILNADVTKTRTGIRYLGQSYAFERDGVSAVYLAGPPEIRGAVMGRFLGEALEKTEAFFFKKNRYYFPNRLVRWMGARYLTIRDSKLITYIPLSIQKEMAGFTTTSQNAFPGLGSFYSRLLQTQRLYESAHRLPADAGMLGAAFGMICHPASGTQMVMGGHLDMPDAEPLDKNKVVVMVAPERGYRYCFIGWAGLFGAFTGMNQAGMGITLVPAHAGRSARLGIPVTLLARQVLAEAGSLEHAVEIIQNAETMQAQSFLIGSGTEDAFWVVEKTPVRTVVRKMRKNYMIATDFFQAAAWQEDAGNQARRQSGPALYRFNRMKEKLRNCDDGFDAEKAVAVLRDRRGEFGSVLGLGNMRAINSLCAVQAVVMDLKQRIIWVSAPPHQIGKFVAFDMDHFSQNKEALHIHQDSFFCMVNIMNILFFNMG